MTEAIGATLGYAIGIATSPVPIAAVILMLFSGRARVNSVAFMIAWVVGIAAVASIVTALPGLEGDDRQPSDTAGWIKLGLGALLLVASVRQWRTRPGPEDDPETPGWMARIDELTPVAAFGLGLVLSAVNPKNLVLAAAAGATFGSLDLTGGETVGAVAVFTAVAAVTVVAPVVAYLVAGSRLDEPLEQAKDWLLRNNQAVMAVLLVVFGIVLIGDGIEIVGD